jgi:PleD family two-component response regulator
MTSPTGSTNGADLQVLHIDDDATLRDLTAELLERVDDGVTVRSESDPTAVPGRIKAEPIDCVVSDYRMPEMDGLELCQRVRETHSDIPFFLFTTEYSEEVVDRAMSFGVTDYIQKESGTTHYKLLAHRIRNAVRHHRIRERIRQLEDPA